MMIIGWKKKALFLRTTILAAGHLYAKELSPALTKMLEFYARIVAQGGIEEGKTLEGEAAHLQNESPEPRMIWEPASIGGWQIQAGMYLKDNELHWLVHAQRKQPAVSAKDIALLDKVLLELGADPVKDAVIGPHSAPTPHHEPVAFGWWTWRNVAPLLEVQINKAKKGKDAIRIVRQGAEESHGYQHVDIGDRK